MASLAATTNAKTSVAAAGEEHIASEAKGGENAQSRMVTPVSENGGEDHPSESAGINDSSDLVSDNPTVAAAIERDETKKINSRVHDPNNGDSFSDPESREPIKYRVQYLGATNEVLHQYETRSFFDVQDPTHRDDTQDQASTTVFEIVTTFTAENPMLFNGSGGKSWRRTNISWRRWRSMHIHSISIVHALRSVVRYYPSQDLADDVIKIAAPYAILVHHYDQLKEYRENARPDASTELCVRDKDAYKDLGLLLDFLDEHVMADVEQERTRNKKNWATWDMMWVGLKPGTPFITRYEPDGAPVYGVIYSLSAGSFEHGSEPWHINYWSSEYRGVSIKRILKSITCNKFDGEAFCLTRPVDIDASPREPDVETIIAQGELYWKLLNKQCMYYNGKSSTFPYTKNEGLVMVDQEAFFGPPPPQPSGPSPGPPPPPPPPPPPDLLYRDTDLRNWTSDCICPVCIKGENVTKPKGYFPFEDCLALDPKTMDTLKPHQYFLLPNRVWSYIFKTRVWDQLHVESLSEPTFEENMIDSLVMDQKRVQTLKALSKSFARLNHKNDTIERDQWSADFVKGKGNGLIFLLHGKPGVGKTCTAECIAQFTRRPLMVLSSNDIGTAPDDVEYNLRREFTKARNWGAVLLIDEADVFMERRTTADLTRNSFVASFLRALEYYEGILFLTTNRVGSFDDAFISRIHVKLYYSDFDDDSRTKVWKTFIDKLQRERGDYIRLNVDAKDYILRGKEIRAVKWNGREIRNAFQTAVALAEYEAMKDEDGKIVVTDDHLRSVVELSRDFKEYLNELHHGDEGKRAERRRERLEN